MTHTAEHGARTRDAQIFYILIRLLETNNIPDRDDTRQPNITLAEHRY